MDFSTALLAMKLGKAVSRPGLDGFVSMTPGANVHSSNIWSPRNREAARQLEQQKDKQIRVAPSITRCQINGDDPVIVMGWSPSQEDMFADDWQVCL